MVISRSWSARPTPQQFTRIISWWMRSEWWQSYNHIFTTLSSIIAGKLFQTLCKKPPSNARYPAYFTFFIRMIDLLPPCNIKNGPQTESTILYFKEETKLEIFDLVVLFILWVATKYYHDSRQSFLHGN